MNKFAIALFLFAFTYDLDAQAIKERDVPVAVVSKVNTLYPEASKIKWEGEDGMYEASFEIAKKETSVMLSRDGMVVMTEVEIPVSGLPGSIMQYIGMHHPAAEIHEASQQTDNLGIIQYEVEVEGAEYLFDSKGQFLSREEEDEEDDK